MIYLQAFGVFDFFFFYSDEIVLAEQECLNILHETRLESIEKNIYYVDWTSVNGLFFRRLLSWNFDKNHKKITAATVNFVLHDVMSIWIILYSTENQSVTDDEINRIILIQRGFKLNQMFELTFDSSYSVD